MAAPFAYENAAQMSCLQLALLGQGAESGQTMKRVKAGMDISISGCKKQVVLDFDDDATEDEIEESVRQWAMDELDIWWVLEEAAQ